MKTGKQMPRLAIIGVGYLVSLAATFAMVPPAAWRYDVVAPTMSAASLMLLFGPYLLAVGCTTGFLPGFGSLWGLAAILPFYVAHAVFIVVISKRTALWRLFGRFGERARKTFVVLWAVASALGVWHEMPCVTQYDVAVDGGKVPAEGIRLAICFDGEHDCLEAIKAQKPDAVLLSGDIFDDRLPDDNAKTFLAAIARDIPCFYVFGNHEHWSERIPEMREILLAAGVTVLVGEVKTVKMRGVEIDVCGIDDPTYMSDDAWLAQIASVASASNPSRLRILLSHRPEYSAVYEKHGFDIVVSGHLHGGQCAVPFLGIGVCGPSSGGPDVHERTLFPRMAGGAYTLKNGTTMVVSRGLARESTPLPRFFNHPEVVIVNLRPKM